MRVLQVSNIVSHHQLPVARIFAQKLGVNNFRFAATELPMEDRQRMGWNCNENESWIIRAGESAQAQAEFCDWWDSADVVLCGERLFDKMANRLLNSKLTFHMTERWWKPPWGMARLLYPRYAMMARSFQRLEKSPFFHFMSAGEYSASDIKWVADFRNRMWRWGYFTDLPELKIDNKRSNQNLHVLWAGRMLGWKRVDTIIRGFSTLHRCNMEARMTLIGDGPCRRSLEELVGRLGISSAVSFLSPMPVQEVRRWMQLADVYVLSSNGREGWGAVVNEAMSEGCLVIASDAAGAPKTMIRHGENGYLFTPGDWRQLGALLCKANDDASLRLRLAQAGQRAIYEFWSPQIAAGRFLDVCHSLLSKQSPPIYDDGPMVRLS